MRDRKTGLAAALAVLLTVPVTAFGSSHREAPVTALDRTADITDFYAFVSYDDPTKVTFIMNVDPFLEPSNGPNYFPFDPNVVYSIHIDNNYDGVEDVSFEFKFATSIRAPQVFTGFVGALPTGVTAPSNAPAGSAGQLVIPPQITSLDGTGSEGLSLQQTYSLFMVAGSNFFPGKTDLTGGRKLIAVPSNVGPRTMPNYNDLARQGIFSLSNGVRVFAGTVDDPFFIDLGAAFDSLNFRASAFETKLTYGPGIPLPVLSAGQDANDNVNSAPDAVAGFNVNTIAIEVPIAMVTQPGKPIIGAWASTSRPRITLRPPASSELAAVGVNRINYTQVQRMGNPLINELIIGTGSKDMWSMSLPSADSQFASYDLDPVLARAMNAVFGVTVPDPPRTDLLPLVNYTGPFAVTGGVNPIADLLRLNTSVPATTMANRKRLGLVAGDGAGYPNGRRLSDDVVDISLRAVGGILCAACTTNGAPFDPASVAALGDGVNTNDVPLQESFPYVAFAHSGLNAKHQDPAATEQCSPACPQ